MTNVVKLKDIEKHTQLFKRSTFTRWRADGKYPNLFRKIGGTVFVDLDEFERMINGESNEK